MYEAHSELEQEIKEMPDGEQEEPLGHQQNAEHAASLSRPSVRTWRHLRQAA